MKFLWGCSEIISEIVVEETQYNINIKICEKMNMSALSGGILKTLF